MILNLKPFVQKHQKSDLEREDVETLLLSLRSCYRLIEIYQPYLPTNKFGKGCAKSFQDFESSPQSVQVDG